MKRKITFIEVIIILTLITGTVIICNLKKDSHKITGKNSLSRNDLSVSRAKFSRKKENSHITDLIACGISLLKTYNYEEAINYFDRALSIDTETAECWAYKGYALLEEHKLSEALMCLNRSLQINPSMVCALNCKGNVLWYQGKKKEAEMCIDKILEINPSYAEAWWNKGVILYACNTKDRGNEELLLKYADKAIEFAPEHAGLWWSKGYFLHHHMKKPEEAVKYYDRAIEIDPDYCNSWYDRGLAIYEMTGDYKETIKFFDSSLKLNQKNIYILFAKGLFYKKDLKNLNKASENFNKILEFNPGFYPAKEELKNKEHFLYRHYFYLQD